MNSGYYVRLSVNKITKLLRLENYILRIIDLDKLNLVKIAYGGLVLGSSWFLYCPFCRKYDHSSKVVKSYLKIIILIR